MVTEGQVESHLRRAPESCPDKPGRQDGSAPSRGDLYRSGVWRCYRESLPAGSAGFQPARFIRAQARRRDSGELVYVGSNLGRTLNGMLRSRSVRSNASLSGVRVRMYS